MTISPQQLDAIIDGTDRESVAKERSFQVNQIEPVSISSATYASIEVKDDTIHIAQACGDNIVMHKGALLHQDAANEVLNWLKQAAQQQHLQFVAASFREDDQFKNILSRLWLQKDIVPYN